MDIDAPSAISSYAATHDHPATLVVRPSPGKGLGVFATEDLAPTVRPIGQYTGRILFDEAELSVTSEYTFAVYAFNTHTANALRPARLRPVYWIDADSAEFDATAVPIDRIVATSDGRRVHVSVGVDEQQPSWLRFVNSVLPDDSVQPNVEYYEFDGRIYLRIIRLVPAGDELFTDYGRAYWLVNVNDCALQRAPPFPVESAVARMQALLPATLQARTTTLRAWASTSFYSVLFLFERSRDADVGFVVVLGNVVYALRTIRVLNADAIRRRLLAAIDDLAVMNDYTSVLANASVFAADRFDFAPFTLNNGTEMLQRPVAQMRVAEATRADLEVLFGIAGVRRYSIECPDVWRAFVYGAMLPPRSHSQFSASVVWRGSTMVGVAVRRIEDKTLLVVCSFAALTPISDDEALERFVFDLVVSDYEQRYEEPGFTMRVFALEHTNQATWLMQRGYRRRRGRVYPLVPSTILFMRKWPATTIDLR